MATPFVWALVFPGRETCGRFLRETCGGWGEGRALQTLKTWLFWGFGSKNVNGWGQSFSGDFVIFCDILLVDFTTFLLLFWVAEEPEKVPELQDLWLQLQEVPQGFVRFHFWTKSVGCASRPQVSSVSLSQIMMLIAFHPGLWEMLGQNLRHLVWAPYNSRLNSFFLVFTAIESFDPQANWCQELMFPRSLGDSVPLEWWSLHQKERTYFGASRELPAICWSICFPVPRCFLPKEIHSLNVGRLFDIVVENQHMVLAFFFQGQRLWRRAEVQNFPQLTGVFLPGGRGSRIWRSQGKALQTTGFLHFLSPKSFFLTYSQLVVFAEIWPLNETYNL